jgi:hypothetical protein
LADALLELLRDPDRAREMGVRGRQRVVDVYTEHNYVEGVQTVLLAARSGRARA